MDYFRMILFLFCPFALKDTTFHHITVKLFIFNIMIKVIYKTLFHDFIV